MLLYSLYVTCNELSSINVFLLSIWCLVFTRILKRPSEILTNRTAPFLLLCGLLRYSLEQRHCYSCALLLCYSLEQSHSYSCAVLLCYSLEQRPSYSCAVLLCYSLEQLHSYSCAVLLCYSVEQSHSCYSVSLSKL